MNKKINVVNRQTAIAELWNFDSLAEEDDHIEVTEWSTGWGYDICISKNNQNTIISLTGPEFDAIKKCIKILNKIESENRDYCRNINGIIID